MSNTSFHTTISDRRIAVPSGSNLDHYIADVLSSTDYYPFGSPMPGRNSNSADYRFGFNGQEMDNEITGQTGTHTTAMFWEYDSRLGRRWNLDPVVKENESPYLCFKGNPVRFSDLNGDNSGDYYRSNPDGTVTYDHSDENVGDGKVYIDNILIPSEEDRSAVNGKITIKLSEGPIYNEIGGLKQSFTLYKTPYDPNDKGSVIDVLLDAVPGAEAPPTPGIDVIESCNDAHVNINTCEFVAPSDKEVASGPISWIWHLHLNGIYGQNSDGSWSKISSADASSYSATCDFNLGPTPGSHGEGDSPNSPETYSYVFEPKDNCAYIVNYNGVSVKVTQSWFFSVKEGSH